MTHSINIKQRGIEGFLSVPFSESVAGRLAVKQSESDGATVNSLNNDKEAGNEEFLMRASILWNPNEMLDVTTKYETSRFETRGNNIRLQTSDAGAVFTPLYRLYDSNYQEAEFRRSAGPTEKGDTESENLTVTVNWTVGENTVTSISGYSTYDYNEVQDVDFGPVPLLERQVIEDFSQWSQELRFTSPVDEDFDYIGGVYFQSSDVENQANLDISLGSLPTYSGFPALRRAVGYERDSTSYALFGQGSWHFQEQYHVTLGLRYTREEVQASRQLAFNAAGSAQALNPMILAAPSGLPSPADSIRGVLNYGFGLFEHALSGDRSVDNWSPSVKLQMDVTDDLMMYSSVSKAFKSGGFNAGETVGNSDTFEFDDEQALAFEIGGKYSALDGRGFVNFALYYTDFDDLQVSSFVGDAFVVGNAASAVSQGVEVDSQWRLTEGLTLVASAAYLDARYSDYKNGPCPVASPVNTPSGCRQDLSDRELSLAPDWTASLGLNHRWEIADGFSINSQLDASYVGSRYLSSDLDKNTEQSDYALINARVGLASNSGWELSLLGKNLADKEVAYLGNDAPLQDGVYELFLNMPRTIAIQLTVSYD